MPRLNFSRLQLRLSLVIIGLLLVVSLAEITLRSRIANASAPAVVATGEMPTLRGEAAVEQLKQQGLYESLSAAVAKTRYDLHRSDGQNLPARLQLHGEVWHAANPTQGMNAYFSRDGVKVVERSEEKPGWELGLRVTGYGYGQQMLSVGAGEMKADGNRIAYARPVINSDSAIHHPQSAFKEWYVNDSTGVEQGFTIEVAPGGRIEGEALRVRMELAAGWKAELAANGQAITLASRHGQQLHYNKLAAWDANKQPLKAWMEVEGQEVRLAVDDAKAVYPVTIDPTLTQQTKLTASDGAALDRFGQAVAMSGATVVVGANTDDVGGNLDQGSAYVFVRSGNSWTQQAQLTAADGARDDHFGYSVAISGDTIVVGSNLDDASFFDQGSAYVFVRSGTTWTQQTRLTAADGASSDRFGSSVGISGETIVVGAPLDAIGNTTLQGSAYVFVRSGTNWALQQKLTISDGAFGDQFGISVAINGDTMVVGAYGDTVTAAAQGSAYVFVREGTVWRLQQRLTALDGAASDQFGNAVAISGETIVVGAHVDDNTASDSGSAYVFVRSGTTWTQQQKLVASNGFFVQYFGTSVAISGETIVVGGPTGYGAAYIFRRSGTNWTQQKQPLLALDGESRSTFGWSVAIDRETVVAGAVSDNGTGSAYIFGCNSGTWAENTRFTVPNGGYLGASVAISGATVVVGAYAEDAVYVFVRSGAGWTQQQRLTTSNVLAGGWFGYAVAISGETVVIGAPRADGNFQQGAAYVFVRSGTNWTEQQKISGGVVVFGTSVAISGETLVIGSPGEKVSPSSAPGVAHVFGRSGTNWTLQQRLAASDGISGDDFGHSVAISGGTVVVGSPYDDTGTISNHGSAYVFVNAGAGWTQQQKLTVSDGAAGDQFGYSVGISGATIVVGARLDNVGTSVDQGSAYVFVRSGAAWAQQQQLTDISGAAGDEFGYSVASSGETIVVGSPLNRNGDVRKGSAYVYKRSGTVWTSSPRMYTGDLPIYYQLGYAVGVSGETVIVGAPNILAGNITTGAAYIFTPDFCNLSLTGPDLTLSKSDGGATASPGTTIVYNLNYANVGVAQATGVTLSETVPVGTTFNAGASASGWVCESNGSAGARCTLNIGTVAVGATGQRAFAVTVDSTVAAGLNQISNTASIFDDGRNGTDPTLPNTASDGTPLNAQPSLRLTKTDNDATVAPGGTITYALGYSNLGTQGAMGVVITETIPANTTFNAASTAGWNCTGSTCTFNVGSLNAGAIGTVNFIVTVNSALPADVQQITNTARITDDGTNSTAPSTASASDTTQVVRRPVANNDSYSTNRDTPLTVAAPGVLSNDAGSTLTAVLVTNPTSGTLNLNANGSFTFTPAANFTGAVSFTYKANDGAQDSNTATVTINVNAGSNRPPVANNDSYSTNRDTPLTIPAPGVLGNDTDPDGKALTAVLATNPASGTLTLNPNGSFTYTPATNFSGSVSFTYRASDGTSNSNVATVTIRVNAGSNRPPVANADSKATNEDTVLTFPARDLTANDTDADNDTLTVTSVGSASNGTVVLAGGNVTFIPAANRNSPSTAFSFSYTISDGKGGTATGRVNVTVNAINDAPSFTLAGNPPPSIVNASAQTVAGFATGMSAGPPDEAGQSLAFRLTVAGTTGGLTFSSAPAIHAATGALTYAAAANMSGTAIVIAVLIDNGSGVAPNVNTSAPRTFTITVGRANTPPIARNDSYTTNEDVVLNVPAPGVRANDFDAEGSPLIAARVSAPASGTLKFNADGSFTYTPAANFFGTVSFTYRVSDGALTSNTATVAITVNMANDPPNAVDDEAISNRNTAVTINVLANDSAGPDTGETLRVTAVTQGALGAVVLNPDGTITYTPGAVFTGHDMFTYTISDGNGGTDTATVFVEGSHLLDPTPTNVNPRGVVTIKWTAPEGSGARDWIGLYRVGEPDTNPIRSRRFFTDRATSGSRTIVMPRTPGKYEFRYFVDDSFTLVARSITITVGIVLCPTVSRLSDTSGRIRSVIAIRGAGFTGVTDVRFGGARARFFVINDGLILAQVPPSALSGPITLSKTNCPVAQTNAFTVVSNYAISATPTSTGAGGTVTVKWTAPPSKHGRDWIGLFRVGDRKNEAVTKFSTDGATSGNRTVTMPTALGQYEFRYLAHNGHRLTRASLPLTVVAP